VRSLIHLSPPFLFENEDPTEDHQPEPFMECRGCGSCHYLADEVA